MHASTWLACSIARTRLWGKAHVPGRCDLFRMGYCIISTMPIMGRSHVCFEARKQGDIQRMTQRHPAPPSPASRPRRILPLPPDFAFSSSSTTSWGLTLMWTTFGADSLKRHSGKRSVYSQSLGTEMPTSAMALGLTHTSQRELVVKKTTKVNQPYGRRRRGSGFPLCSAKSAYMVEPEQKDRAPTFSPVPPDEFF